MASSSSANPSEPPKRHHRRITSYDVAEQAGVSRTTVSLVLNNVPGVNIPEETRQRVRQTAEELGYTPHAAARALVTNRSNLLGFVLCQSADQVVSDTVLPEVLRGVNDVARSQRYRVLLESLEDVSQPGAYIHLVQEQRIDGLILSGPRSDDYQLVELRRQAFPIVLLGQLPGSGLPCVDVDNVSGARKAVAHLVDLGYRHIGTITNAPPQYTSSVDRVEGARQALQEGGVPLSHHLVHYGNYTEESGYAAMADLLAHDPDVEAVFVASDVVAFGALAAIRESGRRVPEDVAVVGFDDARLARYTSPPLTTVHLPARDLGSCAAQMLLRLILGEELNEEQVFLETELVIRESCGYRLQAAGAERG